MIKLTKGNLEKLLTSKKVIDRLVKQGWTQETSEPLKRGPKPKGQEDE